VVSLFCAGFCLPLFASEITEKVNAKSTPSPDKIVLIVGDSLSAEYGLTRGTGWVQLMSDQAVKETIKVRVVNASISGDTSSGGLSRLPQLLKLHKPQVLIVELGGNDALRGLSMQMTQQNLSAMANQGKKAGAKVMVIAMQIPPNYGANYAQQIAQAYQRVSKETGAELNNQFLKGIADEADPLKWFQPDRIHPNEGAQSAMMKNVWPQLKSVVMPFRIGVVHRKRARAQLRLQATHLTLNRASLFFFQTWLSVCLLFCVSSPILFDVFRSRNWELPRYFFLFNGSTVSACHSILQDA
jgi:acyl-CoA thioesterase-1